VSSRDEIIANAKPFVSLWIISTPIYPMLRPETWTPPATPAPFPINLLEGGLSRNFGRSAFS